MKRRTDKAFLGMIALCLGLLAPLDRASADPLMRGVGNPEKITGKVGATPHREAPARQARSTSRKQGDPGIEAVAAAIAALSKEYAAFEKDPQNARTRSESNYFVDNPSAEVTPELIVKALGNRISGSPRLQAYVKWQLLSAIPGKFDEAQAPAALRAYSSAPAPVAMPGMDPQQRRQIDMALSRLRQDEVAGVDKEISEQAGRVALANAPILAYRDAMFARLPSAYDTYVAGMEDLVQRMGTGADIRGHATNVLGGLQAWALGMDAKPPQVQNMLAALGRLKTLKAPDYISGVTWDSKGNKAKSKSGRSGLEAKEIDRVGELIVAGSQGAGGGGGGGGAGGMKFRDEK